MSRKVPCLWIVRVRPPTRSRASSTSTDRTPCWTSRRAVVRPASPAPTTTTSAFRRLAGWPLRRRAATFAGTAAPAAPAAAVPISVRRVSSLRAKLDHLLVGAAVEERDVGHARGALGAWVVHAPRLAPRGGLRGAEPRAEGAERADGRLPQRRPRQVLERVDLAPRGLEHVLVVAAGGEEVDPRLEPPQRPTEACVRERLPRCHAGVDRPVPVRPGERAVPAQDRLQHGGGVSGGASADPPDPPRHEHTLLGVRAAVGIDPRRAREAAAGPDGLAQPQADERGAVVAAEQPFARWRVALGPADRGHVVPVEEKALLGVHHVRALPGREEAAPFRLACAGIREALVEAARLYLEEPRVPVADVAAIVGGHQVLVPGELDRRAVHVLHAARGVHVGEAHEGADLVLPDRVAAGIGHVAAPDLYP